MRVICSALPSRENTAQALLDTHTYTHTKTWDVPYVYADWTSWNRPACLPVCVRACVCARVCVHCALRLQFSTPPPLNKESLKRASHGSASLKVLLSNSLRSLTLCPPPQRKVTQHSHIPF